jgi:GxxExxY protein
MEIQTDPLARTIIGCAIDVHTALGPGLLESAYEECLARELEIHGVPFARQVRVPVAYKGVSLACGYRVDFLVDSRIVVELKAVARLEPVHRAQVLTYLKLLGVRQGLLMNFHAPRLTAGLKSLLLD